MRLNFVNKVRTVPIDSATLALDGNGGWLESIKDNFPDNLRRLLGDSGLKKGHFAEAVGVSPSMVSQWLGGTSLPELWRFDAIANVLKTDFIELVRNPKVPLEHQLTISLLREMARKIGHDLVKKN